MILPDDTPESPAKSPVHPFAEPPVVRSAIEDQPPPPAYQQRVDEAGPSSVSTPLLRHREREDDDESPKERFAKAFIVAILIWALLAFLLRTTIVVAIRRDEPYNDGPIEYPPRSPQKPGKSDGRVIRCVYGASRGDDHTPLSFDLPAGSDALYILGRGALSHGSITIESAPDAVVPDDVVRVHISASYTSGDAMRAIDVCELERSAGERGIGILTPTTWRSYEQGEITISVLFPARRTWDPLKINAFETDLAHYAHTVASLEGKVVFRSVSLASTLSTMHSHFLEASHLKVQTTNAQVTGTYHATDSLDLATSNDAIVADVTLYSNDGASQNTTARLASTNGVIEAALHLKSSSPSGAGGAFTVDAGTTNGHLRASVSSLPADGVLVLGARTTNAHAAVAVPPAFEGAWRVATSRAHATTVVTQERASDPAGRGRSRHLTIARRERGLVLGEVAWGWPVDRRLGALEVTTTNADVSLSM